MDQELVKDNDDLKISKKLKNDMVNKKAKSFRLTDRDFEIFAFLLEQKFGSLEQIYFRFFDARGRVADPLPKGLHVTRQRLQILKRNGFIKSEKCIQRPGACIF